MSTCGQLCASWWKFLYIGLHVKPRLHAWHIYRQSCSHFAFSSLSGMNADCIWRLTSIQYVCPNLAPAWTLASEFDRINWPLTPEMFTFWICTRVLQWLCLKAVSVSMFVLGGLRGSTATSDLVSSFFSNPGLCLADVFLWLLCRNGVWHKLETTTKLKRVSQRMSIYLKAIF